MFGRVLKKRERGWAGLADAVTGGAQLAAAVEREGARLAAGERAAAVAHVVVVGVVHVGEEEVVSQLSGGRDARRLGQA